MRDDVQAASPGSGGKTNGENHPGESSHRRDQVLALIGLAAAVLTIVIFFTTEDMPVLPVLVIVALATGIAWRANHLLNDDQLDIPLAVAFSVLFVIQILTIRLVADQSGETSTAGVEVQDLNTTNGSLMNEVDRLQADLDRLETSNGEQAAPGSDRPGDDPSVGSTAPPTSPTTTETTARPDASAAGHSAGPTGVHSSGNVDLPSDILSRSFDLDDWVHRDLTTPPTDVGMSLAGGVLANHNGAQVASAGSATYEACRAIDDRDWSTSINLEVTDEGDHFCYMTDDDRPGVLTITSIDGDGESVSFVGTTWNPE